MIFLFHIWSLYTVGYKCKIKILSNSSEKFIFSHNKIIVFPFGWVLRERSLSLVFTPLLLSMIGHVQTVFPVVRDSTTTVFLFFVFNSLLDSIHLGRLVFSKKSSFQSSKNGYCHFVVGTCPFLGSNHLLQI